MARALVQPLIAVVAKLDSVLDNEGEEIRTVLAQWDRFLEHPTPGSEGHRAVYDQLMRAMELLRRGSELSELAREQVRAELQALGFE